MLIRLFAMTYSVERVQCVRLMMFQTISEQNSETENMRTKLKKYAVFYSV